MEKTLLAQGKIASQDMNLFGTTDDPEEMVKKRVLGPPVGSVRCPDASSLYGGLKLR